MVYGVSYDIVSDRTRRKVSKILEGYGVRIQYSVFECRLNEKRFQKMYQDIFKVTENEQDGSIRIYMLCKNCENRTVTIGKPMGQLEVLQSDVIVI